MITVKLHGWLGDKYGAQYNFAVTTPAQAINMLRANFKTFEVDVCGYDRGYNLLSGNNSIDVDELHVTTSNVFHIVPAIGGSNNMTRIVVGAIMMYAAYQYGYTPATEATATTAASAGGFSFGAGIAFNVGLSLMMGGVIGMITPTPKADQFSSETAANTPSYMFNGAINTTGQGNPVSILYGKLLIGSQVISAGLSTRQVTV